MTSRRLRGAGDGWDVACAGNTLPVTGDGNEREANPDVRFEFGHDPSAAAHARHVLEPLIDSPDDPIADDVRLVTSELVSNVYLHTDDGGTMQAWDPKPDVPFRVEVADGDRGTPGQRGEPSLVGGHGMNIVEACSDNWGVQRSEDGKVVWAEFDRQLRSGHDHDHDPAAAVRTDEQPPNPSVSRPQNLERFD